MSSSDFCREREDIDFGLLGRDMLWDGKGEGVEARSVSGGGSGSTADELRRKRSADEGLIVERRLLEGLC
jgi:hypothetical protein